MELEVSVVSGVESCFASLPLSLIETLQSTSGGFLPPVLALELRSRSSGALWNLAWSGSASRSSAIEVAQQVSECIGLPDRTAVVVKVMPQLTKAIFVSIEPFSEDDWEILELNSDLAEDALLKQVGIVYEGMKFPLWLHGHTVVTFIVISVSPRKPVVQLVPGTEVTVAPKLRKKIGSSEEMSSSDRRQLQKKALLRVQAPVKMLVHRINFQGLELGVNLTSAVFVHPETARNFNLDNSELVVIIPKLHREEDALHQDRNTERGNNSLMVKSFGGSVSGKDASRHALVYVLLSDNVVKGHVMLPSALQLFLRCNLHSWVCLKSFNSIYKKEVPDLTLSVCQFKLAEKSSNSESSRTALFGSFQNSKIQGHLKAGLSSGSDTQDNLLQVQEVLLSFFSGAFLKQSRQVSALTGKLEPLIHGWIVGQQKAISCHADVDIRSMVLARETILHFEVTGSQNFEKVDYEMSSNKSSDIGGSPAELLFILSTSFEGLSFNSSFGGFELPVGTEDKYNADTGEFNLKLGELDVGDPIFLDSNFDRKLDRNYASSIFSLRWLETAFADAVNRILDLLSSSSVKQRSIHHLPIPGHVLIYGPPGSGKTSLMMAIAKHFEEHKEILAHIVFINCSKVALEKTQSIRHTLSSYISESFFYSPSLVFFDDLDLIVPSSDIEASQQSNSSIQLAKLLMEIIDEYGEKQHNFCGLGPVAFVASAQSLTSLPRALSSSGRFDFHIQLPTPAASEREDILKHELYKRSLDCSTDILCDIASKCDGYDAYDLEILVDRAIHSSIGRYLCHDNDPRNNGKPSFLVREDFVLALKDFIPVAMRGLTKGASLGIRSGWDDVGGLANIRNLIQEMIEMPSKYPSIFAEAPLRLRSNVLLFGPPGCGKTHLVGAAASACSLRFISIKGPELLNKYIGASEQAVRDLFRKAAAAAPCLLFFDEFDSIAPKRGHDNTGVTDRVVNQLLTELDGVEALTGVFVFAATSRPDLLDAALLRPGRLDRLLFCDFPSCHERLDILKVLSKKLPLAEDVNLEMIASMTEGFSGADLQALLSDAQLASVHELLENDDSSVTAKQPIINGSLLMSVASKARPSVSESEKRRLYAIYNEFLDTKKSMGTQSRDLKGKRATLA